MRFKNNAKTVFLDVNSLVGYKKTDDIKKLNIILSPSMYWVKKVSLPVKYIRDAIKLLPSIFEDTLMEGNYSYSAYKDGDDFFVFAYEDKKIIDTLVKFGINLSDVENIYFAQSEMGKMDKALKIDEKQTLYVKDDIVVLVPCCWIKESGTINLDSLKLSKHTVKLKHYGHIVEDKSFYKIGTALVVLCALVFMQYFITSQKVSKIELMKSEVFAKYNLKSTMFQNKSMLKKYKKIHQRQTKIREYISYILSFKLTSKEKLFKIALKDDAIKAEFSHVSTSTLSRLNNYLKSKKVRFNINMKNSKVYLEMIL
jgi:hypothetical protein